MIKCPNCGGELKYNVLEKMVKCDHCGSKFNPDEQIAKEKMASESSSLEGKVFSCTQCGASLMTFDETAVTFCSYCGSQAMIESKMMKQNNPDYIIPFKVTKDECIASYKKMISKSLFVPISSRYAFLGLQICISSSPEAPSLIEVPVTGSLMSY